jgi:protein-S-isoprenylcysteine O-methyltransferase Ste14
MLMRVVLPERRRREMKPKKSKAAVLVALQFLFLLLLILNPFASILEIEPTLSVALYLIAALILVSAAVALGSALTASPIPKDDAELVTHGIYRWVRHPMYTALIFIGLALLLGTFNPFSLFLYASLLSTLHYKSRYEDALLAQRHQGASEYQKSTGRFFPRF